MPKRPLRSSSESSLTPRAKPTPDGVLLRKSGVNPQLGKENIYMTMRLMVSGNKLFTLVFNYTESNKVILSKYVDPVINSIQAPK